MNNITKLNKLIYAGLKLICAKIGIPQKNMNRNSKPGCEIGLEMQIWNLWEQAKTLRQRKNTGICLDEKRKSMQQLKTNNITWRNKSEGTGERRMTKKILR